MRRVCRARREIDKKRLVRHERLFLTDPLDGLVGHVAHKVVAVGGGFARLDRGRAFVNRRVILVGLAADEPVEVFEAAATGRPGVERTQRAWRVGEQRAVVWNRLNLSPPVASRSAVGIETGPLGHARTVDERGWLTQLVVAPMWPR